MEGTAVSSGILESDFRIVCLCPTYRKTKSLFNSCSLFLQRTYKNAILYILDDDDNFYPYDDNNIYLEITSERFPDLASKYIYMATRALNLFSPDGFLVWEDDDIYHPDHIAVYAKCFQYCDWIYPLSKLVYYDNKVSLDSFGSYHSSLGFSANLVRQGVLWPATNRPTFDQEFIAILNESYRRIDPTVIKHTFMFRWNNINSEYHSQGFIQEMDNPNYYDIISLAVEKPKQKQELRCETDIQTPVLVDIIDKFNKKEISLPYYVSF